MNWVVYISPSTSHWIIGTAVALGTPIDINAWIYTEFSGCPENEIWRSYWDTEENRFVNTTENDIRIECVDKDYVTLKSGEKVSTTDWLEVKSKEEVEDMIRQLDADNNGTVSFHEFLMMMGRKMTAGEEDNELRQAFNVFDDNSDGFIR